MSLLLPENEPPGNVGKETYVAVVIYIHYK